jgi:hypothetical protein
LGIEKTLWSSRTLIAEQAIGQMSLIQKPAKIDEICEFDMGPAFVRAIQSDPICDTAAMK